MAAFCVRVDANVAKRDFDDPGVELWDIRFAHGRLERLIGLRYKPALGDEAIRISSSAIWNDYDPARPSEIRGWKNAVSTSQLLISGDASVSSFEAALQFVRDEVCALTVDDLEEHPIGFS